MEFKLTEKQVNELKGIFPYGYTSKIATRLNEAGKKTSRGKEYTHKMVSDVMTLKREDINIFIELMKLKIECLQKKEERKNELNQVMGKIEQLSNDNTTVATAK